MIIVNKEITIASDELDVELLEREFTETDEYAQLDYERVRESDCTTRSLDEYRRQANLTTKVYAWAFLDDIDRQRRLVIVKDPNTQKALLSFLSEWRATSELDDVSIEISFPTIPRWQVEMSWDHYATITVEAENESDAIKAAWAIVMDDKFVWQTNKAEVNQVDEVSGDED